MIVFEVAVVIELESDLVVRSRTCGCDRAAFLLVFAGKAASPPPLRHVGRDPPIGEERSIAHRTATRFIFADLRDAWRFAFCIVPAGFERSLDPRQRSSASEDIALGLEPAVVVVARREADSARVGKLIRSLGNLQLKLEQGLVHRGFPWGVAQ